MKIGLIDLNTGNMGSLISAMSKLNIKIKICNSKNDLSEVKKIILPGVGAFKDFMKKIKIKGLDQEIKNYLNKILKYWVYVWVFKFCLKKYRAWNY